VPLCALAALALVLSACGSDERDERDEDKVVKVVEAALTRTDPADCKELKTRAYSEQSFRTEGVEAVESCEQNARAEESPNEIGEVTNVKVNGARATADVADATAGGQGFAVGLIEEDGDWKLNEIVSFAGFDRDKLLEEQKEAFEGADPAFEPQEVDCILKAFRGLSRSEWEDLMIGGSARPEIEIYERCQP
jgi:hypothetical protein